MREGRTVRRKRFGMTGSSTACCMKAARISGRKPSAIEKQIEMAAHEGEGRQRAEG